MFHATFSSSNLNIVDNLGHVRATEYRPRTEENGVQRQRLIYGLKLTSWHSYNCNRSFILDLDPMVAMSCDWRELSSYLVHFPGLKKKDNPKVV